MTKAPRAALFLPPHEVLGRRDNPLPARGHALVPRRLQYGTELRQSDVATPSVRNEIEDRVELADPNRQRSRLADAARHRVVQRPPFSLIRRLHDAPVR